MTAEVTKFTDNMQSTQWSNKKVKLQYFFLLKDFKVIFHMVFNRFCKSERVF